MQIKHKIDSFLSEVFLDLGLNPEHDRVIDVMVKYYTFGPYKPKVTVTGSEVVIDVAVDIIERQGPEYKRALALCDQRNYAAAKKILSDLIDKNPSVSEYHRVLGQVESEEGNQDKAIDHLIDALRWDSHNGWALLMVGNIFAKYKKDTETATKYYDQAISCNTADHISLTNAAYIMLLDDNISKAAEYINKAIDLKPDYPNALMVQGMISDKEGNKRTAFNYYIATLKEIATEIAMQGIHGYSTDGTIYRLANVPGKKFTGYEILAWYYVSWAMAMPEMLKELRLPYDREYELAKAMVK
ncbi:MAG: hypothetical protein CV087_19760 [Candidatus Brocadia sp. WS118]|nr:MAG: hypothetical protein CV087_19760 [Candidatus Brocadia sp. WS118]